MQTSYGVWSNTMFARYIQENSIFLHLHKRCETNGPVTAARMSNLLSAGAIIISMVSHPSDEKEFDGLVIFAPIQQMQPIYANISLLSREARRDMGNRIRAAFAKRFAPAAIFRQAGIYNLMDRLQSKTTARNELGKYR